jgi:Xaa-Pro aminopeptidase
VSSERVSGFFGDNRRRLAEKLRGGIVVISAYSSVQRGNDMSWSFEQEANFWWLCGLELPNWWLIIDASRDKSWLVAPVGSMTALDKDSENEKIRQLSGVDDILTQDAGIHMLRELSKRHSIVRTLGDQPHSEYLDFFLNPAPKRMYDILDRIFNTVQDCRRELAQLRALKQPEEITRIKRAINLTIAGFEEVKSQFGDMKFEYEIEAVLTHHFRRNGAKGHAYDPVVASGVNACNLRYVANSEKLRKRETILIDAGVRLQGYAAGLARTSSYGESTHRQIDVSEALKQAHEQIIKLLSPNLAVDQYQREVDSIMQDTLLNLGLMASQDDLVSYRRYFPHAISRGVGVDVHDSLGSPHFFQPGMVLTVEPGIYIPEEKIGMRLGDMILITQAGHANLSKRLSTDL